MRTYRPMMFLLLLMLAMPALVLGAGKNRDDNPPPATTGENDQVNVNQTAMEVIENWPDASQRAANELIQKYGQPDAVTETHIMWVDEGNFKEINVYAEPIRHNFPTPHEDVVEHVVYMEVPEDKICDLADFDGSVVVHRTAGTVAVRCQNEASNVAVLNQVHAIVRNNTPPQQARQQVVQAMQRGGTTGSRPANVQLNFQPASEDAAADPGQTFEQMGTQQGTGGTGMGTGTTGRGTTDTMGTRTGTGTDREGSRMGTDTTQMRDTSGIRNRGTTGGTGTGMGTGTRTGTGTGTGRTGGMRDTVRDTSDTNNTDTTGRRGTGTGGTGEGGGTTN